MAAGDITFFNSGLESALENWAGTDTIRIAIIDNTVTPTAGGTATLATYTIATTQEGPTSLGTWANFVTYSGTTTTFDSATNPSWAQNAGNDADARWGIIYNDTDASDTCLAFVDLGATVDLTAGSLTITWNASGIATIT